MPTFRSLIVKALNRVPIVKAIIIWIVFESGGFKRLVWLYYQSYFFLVNILFSLSKTHGCLKNPPLLRSAIFFLPKYISGEDLYETSEEMVLCFKELYPGISVEYIYYDESEFINNKESSIRHLIAANPSHFIYFYTNNPFSLPCRELKAFLRQLSSYKIIIASDSIRLPHAYFLNKMKNDVDMIVGLDAPIRFGSRKSKLIGVLPSVISQHTFERLIKPNLSIPRDIDILIIGEERKKRVDIANYLRNNGLEVLLVGGQYGPKRIPYDKYYLMACRSKIKIITLFTDDELHIHLKGHIAEAAAAASLIFVDAPKFVSPYFEENKEFISFASLEELLEKVKWYLSHDEERVKVSMAAHHRWLEQYSGGKFWINIFSSCP